MPDASALFAYERADYAALPQMIEMRPPSALASLPHRWCAAAGDAGCLTILQAWFDAVVVVVAIDEEPVIFCGKGISCSAA